MLNRWWFHNHIVPSYSWHNLSYNFDIRIVNKYFAEETKNYIFYKLIPLSFWFAIRSLFAHDNDEKKSLFRTNFQFGIFFRSFISDSEQNNIGKFINYYVWLWMLIRKWFWFYLFFCTSYYKSWKVGNCFVLSKFYLNTHMEMDLVDIIET